MTKPISRKMAVDALLHRFATESRVFFSAPLDPSTGVVRLVCAICGEPLLPGQAIQFDHVHGHAMGGAHEYQNLRPVHYDPCHKAKSARDVAALAKVDRITGVTKKGPKAKIAGGAMAKRPPGAGNGFPPRGSTPMRRKP